MKMWSYQDKKMKQLRNLYKQRSQKTQNRLQETFNLLNIDELNVLYSIADDKFKRKVNAYIDDWRVKGYLRGFFGDRANYIYRRKKVKYNEILWLFIYFAYLEEAEELTEKEMAIFRDTVNYYYKDGQKQAGAKETKELTDKQFNELIDTPNVAGYTWAEYKGSEALRNTYEITREATQEIQQGKKPDVDSELMQKQIENQINRKIKIKDNKISGNADLTTIGMDNQSIIWGIEEIDHDAKVKFIAVMDDRTTKMCTSLDGQIFNVHGWNEFLRYSETNGKQMKYRCFGLVQGLNLPPIDDHFHWCRSTVVYNIDTNREDVFKN